MTSQPQVGVPHPEIPLRVDVAFPVAGEPVPLDHGYTLFSAICRVLGNLHGAPWLSIHPLMGTARDGELSFRGHNLALRLRVTPAEIPRILPLAGNTIELCGRPLQIGVSRVFALTPSPKLFARMAVIKGFMEEGPFEDAVRRRLDDLGVTARVEIGRRRVMVVNGDHSVGFETVLHDISLEHSMVVQCAGIGGRQRMGCGVFVPAGKRA